ncbi:hypothetical protein [Melittangium boletus]|uniref:Uncharacterized protein n=1 Tax=Melittangium boletus DSM 14713 TaxID=1294270 RepID=A0A250I7J1_9BACT|nr:hypothetical protein [Melittangium boletus]ATB27745.1 hypothetical protein MEBOL_001190 [Melittangium boletus DSM 14713]
MSRRQRPKTIIELETHRASITETPRESGSDSVELDPLYGVALLKVALELKRRKDGTPEEILRAVLLRMRLSEVDFRAWLAQRGELAKVFGET